MFEPMFLIICNEPDDIFYIFGRLFEKFTYWQVG